MICNEISCSCTFDFDLIVFLNCENTLNNCPSLEHVSGAERVKNFHSSLTDLPICAAHQLHLVLHIPCTIIIFIPLHWLTTPFKKKKKKASYSTTLNCNFLFTKKAWVWPFSPRLHNFISFQKHHNPTLLRHKGNVSFLSRQKQWDHKLLPSFVTFTGLINLYDFSVSF